MVRASRVATASLVTCAWLSAATATHAQDASTTGAATVLFDEGVALMEKGQFAEACPKLSRSQELSPNGGTLLALAECYEKTGKTASAWVAYKEAAVRANAAKRAAAEKSALAAAKRLAPNVSHMVVKVTNEVEGLTITRDGRSLTRAEWDLSLPIDPGEHRIEASAVGHRSWSSTFDVGTAGTTREVVIPALERAPAAVPPTRPEPRPERPPAAASSDEPPSGVQRTVGLVTGAIGLVGIGVGSYFGLRAMEKNDEASEHCRSDTACDDVGLRLDEEGRDAGLASTVAFASGGALVAIGAILFFTSPRAPGSTTTSVWRAGRRASLGFGGAF